MNLTNLEFDLGPKVGLQKAEADAIVAVVMSTIDNFFIPADSGTFLLYGVKNGEHEPERLISFDLGSGPTKKYFFGDEDSRQVAMNTLEHDAKVDHSDESPHGAISYYVDTPLFLDFWADSGRFICAFFANNVRYDDMTHVYCAVVQTLALMRRDWVSEKSCDEVFYTESRKNAGVYEVKCYVKELFEKCELPELKAWKEWHDHASAKLPCFFMGN